MGAGAVRSKLLDCVREEEEDEDEDEGAEEEAGVELLSCVGMMEGSAAMEVDDCRSIDGEGEGEGEGFDVGATLLEASRRQEDDHLCAAVSMDGDMYLSEDEAGIGFDTIDGSRA